MSNRELIVNLIDDIPEYKLNYVVDILKVLRNLIDDEDAETVDPDEIDIAMIEEAEKINDETYITLEELAEKLDINV